jgi:hypothetical protein
MYGVMPGRFLPMFPEEMKERGFSRRAAPRT